MFDWFSPWFQFIFLKILDDSMFFITFMLLLTTLITYTKRFPWSVTFTAWKNNRLFLSDQKKFLTEVFDIWVYKKLLMVKISKRSNYSIRKKRASASLINMFWMLQNNYIYWQLYFVTPLRLERNERELKTF